ncbi:hypothetical protein MTP16_13870 [Hymenobacter monticola]|uniref:Uncharacterized protein n=1 Tax=Hymenobacter monticola TaxID=1705399 RepID=A0ABY4B363_9BACT|nr:hypothetical protein [Hymenobacter monticola]UOE32218.1 hypothetical protein MTP16_13870 [Hymenobacter monticola]
MLTEFFVFAGVVISAYLTYRGVCRNARAQEETARLAAQATVAVALINAGAQQQLKQPPQPNVLDPFSGSGGISNNGTPREPRE